MPHVFGRDAHSDARWLALLDTRVCSSSLQRTLLRGGWSPEQLLGLKSDHPLAEPTGALRAALSRVAPAALPNAIDPRQAVSLLTLGGEGYPPLLARCDDAPPALFVVGDVSALNATMLAIVGARRASPVGLDIAGAFAQAIAATGIAIASGLALGIDAAAHKATLEGGGKTIAVSPVGVDLVYPRQHGSLARDIARQGAVISEFLPGSKPLKHHFHRRNRTLSGLSLGTLVVEAGRPSGSLITATAAAQQGREVFAVPWSLRHAGGAGCLHLIADGATLVRRPVDIVEQLVPGLEGQIGLQSDDCVRPALSPQLSAVVAALNDERVSTDQIAARLGLSVPICLQMLIQLELHGLVVRQGGNWVRSAA